MRSDALGSAEPSRVINTGAVGERHHRTDPGSRHQASAHWIGADLVEQHLVQFGKLHTQGRARGSERDDHGGDGRQVKNEVAHALLETDGTHDPDLQAEVA